MIVVNHTSSAQYPTTKNIKGQDVVIMTVPQAKAIDEKFLLLKDSIKLLNVSLFQNRENLKLTGERLNKTNTTLSITQESLNQTTLQNETYLKEIERYKKMEFEDKKIMRRTTIGFATVAVFWVLYVVSAMAQ